MIKYRFSDKISDCKLIETFKQSFTVKIHLGKGYRLFSAESDKREMTQFPTPAYHLLNINDYFVANVQFSSGCPYSCEFCEIPELYSNSPRIKTLEQVVVKLDAMRQSGNLGAVYFVDDNFVGDRRAAMKLLPHRLG